MRLARLPTTQRLKIARRALFADYEKNRDSVDRNLIPALWWRFWRIPAARRVRNIFRSVSKTPKRRRKRPAICSRWQTLPTPELIDRTLDLTINGKVRTQNSPYLMRGMLLNKHGRERAWSFMKVHWDEMHRQYPDNAIPRMCEGIVGLVSAELEKDVVSFFARPSGQAGEQADRAASRTIARRGGLSGALAQFIARLTARG